MEEWRTIAEAPNYEVSSERRVRNKNTGRVLRQNQNDQVNLMHNGERLCRTAWLLKRDAFGSLLKGL